MGYTENMKYFGILGFRLYEILIGDMLHLFRVAAEADWELMAEQAKKHRWLEQFHNGVAVLNGFHRQLYQETNPMEKYCPAVAQAK